MIPTYLLQFAPLNFTLTFAGEPNSSLTYRNVTVDGKPVSGVTVTKVSANPSGGIGILWTINFQVTGAFGDDIATQNKFITVKESDLSEKTYTDYDVMLSEFKTNWDVVRYYAPDPSPTKLATFNFINNLKQTRSTSVTVYTVPDRWYSRLQTVCQLIRPARVIANSSGSVVNTSGITIVT